MDYQLLMKSKEVILEPCTFIIAYRQGKSISGSNRTGIEAEQRCLKQPKSQYHKGLIFVLGNTYLLLVLFTRKQKGFI